MRNRERILWLVLLIAPWLLVGYDGGWCDPTGGKLRLDENGNLTCSTTIIVIGNVDASGTVECDIIRADTYKTEGGVQWGAADDDGGGSKATMTLTTSPVITPGTLPASPATGELASDSGAANAAKMWDGAAWDVLSN